MAFFARSYPQGHWKIIGRAEFLFDFDAEGQPVIDLCVEFDDEEFGGQEFCRILLFELDRLGRRSDADRIRVLAADDGRLDWAPYFVWGRERSGQEEEREVWRGVRHLRGGEADDLAAQPIADALTSARRWVAETDESALFVLAELANRSGMEVTAATP